jgi:hypothetical protein
MSTFLRAHQIAKAIGSKRFPYRQVFKWALRHVHKERFHGREIPCFTYREVKEEIDRKASDTLECRASLVFFNDEMLAKQGKFYYFLAPASRASLPEMRKVLAFEGVGILYHCHIQQVLNHLRFHNFTPSNPSALAVWMEE